jgi:ABC-type sugar transport systems, permease components
MGTSAARWRRRYTAPAFFSQMKQRMESRHGWLPYLMVCPTLLLILIIAIYPMLDSLRISMLDNPLLPQPVFVGLRNYSQILRDSVFLQATTTTLIFTFISVACELVLGLGLALFINQTFPGRSLVHAVILVPWAFPTVVTAQMWLLMYNDQTGIITVILQWFGALAPGGTLLNSTGGVIAVAIIADVWKTTPFMVLLILAGLQVIPIELYESASVDGASRWQRFVAITLPLLKRVLLIALLFRLLDAVRVFDLFYVLGQRSTPSLADYANFKMFSSTVDDFSPGVAAAVVVFCMGLVLSLCLLLLMRDYRRKA